MRSYFLYMAGWNGRILRSLIAIVMMLASVIPGIYQANLILFIAGIAFLSAAIWNLLILAPLFGYPVSGNKIKQLYDEDSLEHKMELGKHRMRDPGRTISGEVTADFKPETDEKREQDHRQDFFPTQAFRYEDKKKDDRKNEQNEPGIH